MEFNSGFKGLMELKFSRRIFEKYPKVKVHKNPVLLVLRFFSPTHRKDEA